jgi:hypothetical protein
MIWSHESHLFLCLKVGDAHDGPDLYRAVYARVEIMDGAVYRWEGTEWRTCSSNVMLYAATKYHMLCSY